MIPERSCRECIELDIGSGVETLLILDLRNPDTLNDQWEMCFCGNPVKRDYNLRILTDWLLDAFGIDDLEA
jgi:hypothetical protein